jgi:hypothetical protein
MDPRDEVRDELLGRVVDELRALPPVGDADVRRIAAAAMAAGRDADDVNATDIAPARRQIEPRWRAGVRRVPLAWAAGITLLAGGVGFLSGRIGREGSTVATAPAPEPSGVTVPSVALAAADERASETAPRFTQFVLEAPSARAVSLVGDFNGWNPDSTRLVRDASGIWTATIALVPGRHVYAFMVNDTVLTLDPRAPETRDPDLGTRASVVLVGAH